MTKGLNVEVKIGVQHVAREIVLESEESPDALAQTVSKAMAGGGVLSLTDDKGRVVIVRVETLGYVDIGPARRSGVGFGSL